MKDQPYAAHDATTENQGVTVWNVKGPGYDRLFHGVDPWAAELRAITVRNDLNLAYRQGYEAGKKETAQ